MSVILKGYIAHSFTPIMEVLQGSILSLFLYLLYINHLPIHLRSQNRLLPKKFPRLHNFRWLNILLCASDCDLIGCPGNIQKLLDECNIVAQLMGFGWNTSKSIVLKHTPLLDSAPIPYDDSSNYLGIPISAPYNFKPTK